MNRVVTMTAALLAGSLLVAQADDAKGRGRILVFGEVIQTEPILLGQGVKDQPERQGAPGIRVMGAVTESGRWCYEVAWRFDSAAHMTTNRDISSAPPANVLDVTKTKVHYTYWSVGAAYLLPLGERVTLGFHREGRAETINPKGTYSSTNGGTSSIDAHSVYFRPWGRVSIETAFKTGPCHTILGLDAGLPGYKTSQNKIVPMSVINTNTLRAMAPQWCASAYAGISF